MPKDLGSNPNECHIFLFVPLRSLFSATLAKRWNVKFRLGFAKNSTMLIQITACIYQKITMLYIYIRSHWRKAQECQKLCVYKSRLKSHHLVPFSVIIYIIYYIIYILFIYNIAVLIIICRFLINVVVRICKPLSKLDLPTLRKGSMEERTQRKKWKNQTLAWTRTQVPGFSSADALATKLRVPVAEPEFFNAYMLSDLKFTPLPSFNVDFSRHVVT